MITRACIDRVIAGLQNSPVEPTFMAFLEFCRHLPALPPGERIKLIVELRPDGFPADLLPGGCYITRYDMLRLRSDCSGTYPGAVGVAAQEMREAITHWKDLATKQTTHREAVERQLKTLWYQQRLAAYSRAHRTEVPCSDVDVAVYRACLQQLGPGDTAASLLQLLRITNGAERIVQWYDSLVEVMDSEAARTADVWPTLPAWCGLQSDVGPPGLLLPAVAPALGDLPGTASAPIIADVVGSPLNSRDNAPTVPGTTGVDPGTIKLRAPVSSKGAMSTVPYTVVSCPLSPVSVVLKQVQTSRAAEATPSVAEGVGLSCYDVAVRAYDTGQTGGPPRAVTESTLSPLDPSDISIPCHVSAMVPTAGAVPGEDAWEAANLTDRSKKRPRSLDKIVAPPSSGLHPDSVDLSQSAVVWLDSLASPGSLRSVLFHAAACRIVRQLMPDPPDLAGPEGAASQSSFSGRQKEKQMKALASGEEVLELVQTRVAPQQDNGHDCGVYTALYADAIAANPDGWAAAVTSVQSRCSRSSAPDWPIQYITPGDAVLYRIALGAAMISRWRRLASQLCHQVNQTEAEAEKILNDAGWYFDADPPLFNGLQEEAIGDMFLSNFWAVIRDTFLDDIRRAVTLMNKLTRGP